MIDLSNVPFNARIFGADGNLVGFVDAIEDGATIRLKTSSCRYGTHERIPVAWVESVDRNTVRLFQTESEARAALDGGKSKGP